jgi:hypothetical protein
MSGSLPVSDSLTRIDQKTGNENPLNNNTRGGLRNEGVSEPSHRWITDNRWQFYYCSAYNKIIMYILCAYTIVWADPKIKRPGANVAPSCT